MSNVDLLRLIHNLIRLGTIGGAVSLSMASILGPIAMTRYAMGMFNIKADGLIGTLGRLASRAIPMVGQALIWLGRAAMANPLWRLSV